MWFFKKRVVPAYGLIKDPRPAEAKEKDYQVEEILTATPVEWREKQPAEWRKLPIFNQDGSGSCVAQTVAKTLGVENVIEENKFVHFSARDIYARRANQGSEGMWLQDALEICRKYGVTLEQLMPSQGLDEATMRKADDRKTIDEQIALVGKPANYVQAENADFDAIANVLLQGKAVAIACRFNAGDWNTAEVVCRPLGQYGHLVTVVDFTLYKGEKALIFDNSWTPNWGIAGQGILRESQKDGIAGWGYFLPLKNTWRDEAGQPRPKPSYFFSKDLGFGMRNNDIGMLQECLQYEELFPINVPSTCYYGAITAKAVLDFAKKYLPDAAGYTGNKVDLAIRTKLNVMFK